MSNKKITRKEFISKTGKCAGGLACSPILLSIFQSCGDVIGPKDCNSLYSVTCSAHNSVFNEEGDVISGPAPTPLERYDVSLSDNNSKIIFNAESVETDYEIELIDHPNLENVGGVSSLNETPFNSKGLLMYRKSEEEVIVYSRICPHAGEKTDSFEECS